MFGVAYLYAQSSDEFRPADLDAAIDQGFEDFQPAPVEDESLLIDHDTTLPPLEVESGESSDDEGEEEEEVSTQ